MVTRRDLAVRWAAYAAATLLLMLLDALALRRVQLLGVIPFLPPVLAATVGSLEDAREATVYALVLGVCCDLTLTATLPCLYTLTLVPAALFAALIARQLLQPGLPCALAVSALAFVLVDAVGALPLLLRGAQAGALFSLALRETAVSLLLLPLCYPVLNWVHRRVTL